MTGAPILPPQATGLIYFQKDPHMFSFGFESLQGISNTILIPKLWILRKCLTPPDLTAIRCCAKIAPVYHAMARTIQLDKNSSNNIGIKACNRLRCWEFEGNRSIHSVAKEQNATKYDSIYDIDSWLSSIRGAGGPLSDAVPFLPLRILRPLKVLSENNRKICITIEICITIDFAPPPETKSWKKARVNAP